MKGKDIFDLTIADLEENPIWYFPMEENNDETYVLPLTNQEMLNSDYQLIVKTNFKDSKNNSYIGYIYWGTPDDLEFIKPCIIIQEFNITFWNGIREPNISEINQVKELLGKESFPITFESEEIFSLYSIRGILNGLYYINDLDNIVFKKV